MNFKDKELIIFDFDGTLINSLPDITIALNNMLSVYNLSPLTIKEVTPFIGNGAKPLVVRALMEVMNEKSISKEFLDKAFDTYLSAYESVICEETFMYPNVFDTLGYLHENGYKLVICTNKPFNFIEPIIEKLSIKKFFHSWLGEHSLPTKKPDPAPLLHLAKTTGTAIEKCAMVGDSRNDILAAQNAVMNSIGVTYGYNYNENIADYNPTIVVDDFSELKKVFEK